MKIFFSNLFLLILMLISFICVVVLFLGTFLLFSYGALLIVGGITHSEFIGFIASVATFLGLLLYFSYLFFEPIDTKE